MSWLHGRSSVVIALSSSRSVSSAAYEEVMAGCERLGGVMYGHQRCGGRPRSSSAVVSFRSAVSKGTSAGVHRRWLITEVHYHKVGHVAGV